MPKSNNWTREETIVAFNVYCKVPFKNSSKTNPTIVKYAKIIDRSPSALNMKIGNFGRLDPELKKQGITGLVNGSKLDEQIWDEFNGNWEKLAFESEVLIAKFSNQSVNYFNETDSTSNVILEGIEKETLIKRRVNQSFFRSTILSSYYSKCCITGLSIPDLLIASHIVPWSVDKENRINPRNGLLLNSLHDKAFDNGYLTVTTEYKVKVSHALVDLKHEAAVIDLLLPYNDLKISLPDKFLPSKEFLDYHHSSIFKK